MLGLLFAVAVASEPGGIGLPSDVDLAKAVKRTWVFFRTGDRDRTGLAQEQVQKWQEEHVGNLGTLYRAKVAHMAGPTGQAGDIRGIVFLEPRKQADIEKDFAPDPFVKERLLKVEHFPALTAAGITHPSDEPFQIEALSIVFLKPGPKRPTQEKGHRNYLRKLWANGDLRFFASFPGNKELYGALIFHQTKKEDVEALAADDPMVEEGSLVWSVHPQYLGKGTLRAKARE